MTVREMASRGGRARARALTAERRREIASLAVAARERRRRPRGMVANPASSLDRAYRSAAYVRELSGRVSASAPVTP